MKKILICSLLLVSRLSNIFGSQEQGKTFSQIFGGYWQTFIAAVMDDQDDFGVDCGYQIFSGSLESEKRRLYVQDGVGRGLGRQSGRGFDKLRVLPQGFQGAKDKKMVVDEQVSENEVVDTPQPGRLDKEHLKTFAQQLVPCYKKMLFCQQLFEGGAVRTPQPGRLDKERLLAFSKRYNERGEKWKEYQDILAKDAAYEIVKTDEFSIQESTK